MPDNATKPKKPATMTREEWLNLAATALHPMLLQHGATWPEKIRVSVGFPLGKRSAIGQCWASTASKDGHAEIFIHPQMDDRAQVLRVLLHELIHACTPGDGHKKGFAKIAKSLGFKKPLTKDVPPEERLTIALGHIAKEMPAYPHAALDAYTEPKKQNTRMLKLECPECGYIARTTRGWLEKIGPLCCPCTILPTQMKSEDMDAEEGDDE